MDAPEQEETGGRGRRRRTVLVAVVTAAVAAIIALLAVGLTNQGQSTKIDQAIAAGDRPSAPDLDLTILKGGRGVGDAGQKIRLSDLRGRPVLLNFWASWCVPCADESSVLEGLWRRFGPQGLIVLGVDTQDLSGDARTFLHRHAVTYPSLRDGTDASQQAYETTGVPETFLIDSEGRIAVPIRGPIVGREAEEAVAQRIEALL